MSIRPFLLTAMAASAIVALTARPAHAHCDALDGPVVKAAQDALASRDVNRVLIWVGVQNEDEVRRAFDRTLEVRTLGPKARDLADRYFFETLVRIHRAGEGAPFTGLKPAGQDFGPAIPAADRALQTGDVVPLANLLVEQVRAGLRQRYERVMAAKAFAPHNLAAGREYVERYVSFIHYVEAIYEAATHEAEGHYPEGSPAAKDARTRK